MSHVVSNRFSRILLIAIAVALLIGAWVLGKRHGEKNAATAASSQLFGSQTQSMIDELQVSVSRTQQEMKQLNQLSVASAARTEALQRQLDEQLRKNFKDANDLALYRKIETSNKARAIDVDAASWSARVPDILNLTLIQWRGRDRVDGEVRLSLQYRVSDGSEGAKLEPVALETMAFDFRFFQRLVVKIPSNFDASGTGNSPKTVPESLNVQIVPKDGRLRAVNTTIDWIDIAE